MNAIFRTVMLSSVLDDEDRFRAIIDGAIARGEVEAYDAYVNESTKSRDLRRRRAERERKGAEKHAKKMGIYEKVFGADAEGKGSKKRKHEGDAQELEALVQQKAKARAATFLENLEAKYAGGAKGGKGKKGPGKKHEEPPEEAFQKTAARMNKRKARAPTPPQEESVDEDVTNDEDDEEEEVLDLTLDSPADEDDDDDDEEDTEPAEEEDVAPRKRRRMPQRKVPKRNITAKKAKGSKKR
jgi:DnaJ family protein C protein 9